MRALLVAYHFPPDGEIGGVRPYQLARHFPELGIDCTVLTVESRFAESLDPSYTPEDRAGLRVVRAPVGVTPRDRILRAWRYFSRFRRSPRAHLAASASDAERLATEADSGRSLKSWLLEWLSYPDLRYGWFGPAVDAAERLLASERFDVILSTSPPRVVHMVASTLSRRHGIPWIMDLRDPWISTWNSKEWERSTFARRQLELFSRYSAQASLIVTNTERLRATIASSTGNGARVACVPNGFDPALVSPDEDPCAQPSGFSIGHFGQVMGRRSPKPFLLGLRYWLDQNPTVADQVRVRFVGGGSEASGLTAALGLGTQVVFEPRVPRQAIPRLMAEQYLLLLLANDQPLQVPGKAYEYLAARRRILAFTERESATGDLLAAAPGCAIAERPGDVALVLERFWNEFASRDFAAVGREDFLSCMTYRARASAYASELCRTADRRWSPDERDGTAN